MAQKGRAEEKFFFLSLLFFSAVSVCPTLQFTNHYFVLMLPVVSLFWPRGLCVPVAAVAGGPTVGAGARRAVDSLWADLGRGRLVVHLDSVLVCGGREEVGRLGCIPSNDFQVYPVVAGYLKRPFAGQRPPSRCSARSRSCFFTRIGARSRATFTCTTWCSPSLFAERMTRRR
jgi:hypothetical protein